jgi:hypothetical protein
MAGNNIAFPLGAFPLGAFPLGAFPLGAGAAPVVATPHGGRQFFKRQVELQRGHILREDKELMEFLSILVETELLN